eukprot:348593_1
MEDFFCMEPLLLPPSVISLQRCSTESKCPNYGLLSEYTHKPQKPNMLIYSIQEQPALKVIDPYTYSQLQYQKQYKHIVLQQQHTNPKNEKKFKVTYQKCAGHPDNRQLQ